MLLPAAFRSRSRPLTVLPRHPPDNIYFQIPASILNQKGFFFLFLCFSCVFLVFLLCFYCVFLHFFLHLSCVFLLQKKNTRKVHYNTLQGKMSHSRTWGWYQVKGGIEPPSQDLQSHTLAFMLLNLIFSIRAEKSFTFISCVFVFCNAKNIKNRKITGQGQGPLDKPADLISLGVFCIAENKTCKKTATTIRKNKCKYQSCLRHNCLCK